MYKSEQKSQLAKLFSFSSLSALKLTEEIIELKIEKV